MKLKMFMQDEMSISKGSAVKISNKSVIDKHRDEYAKLVGMPDRSFTHMVYTVSPGNRMMIHIKVPSVSVAEFHYDVLLELSPSDNAEGFEDCDIKVFSNSPSFVYSVAYVFAHWDPDAQPNPDDKTLMAVMLNKGHLPQNRMLIPGTETLLGGSARPPRKDDPDRPKNSVNDSPVIRNPMGIPMFDKSIYLALFYLMNTTTLEKAMSTHHNVTLSQVLVNVSSFDRVMSLRKQAERKQKNTKEKKRKSDQSKLLDHEKKLNYVNKSGMRKPMTAKSSNRGSSIKTTSSPKTTRRTTKP